MRRSRRPAWALVACLLSGGTLAQGHFPGDAVRVNGETISYQRFNGFYTEYRNSKGVAVAARGDQLGLLTRLRQEAMDLMVEQELVAQAAEQAGVEVPADEVDAQVEALREAFDEHRDFVAKLDTEGFTEESYREHIGRMLAAQLYLDGIRAGTAVVDDEALEAYYRDNERRLTLPEQVRVRHILLTWKPMGTTDDRAAIREQMVPVLERARAGEDFTALVQEFSEDYATKKTGGDTGLFHRGQMAPAFEQAAFALEPGQISDIVETPFGVHILKLEERQPERLLPLEDIREDLRAHVRQERAEARVSEEIARLRAEAEIEVLIPLGRPQGR